jgi:gas vesicle protein
MSVKAFTNGLIAGFVLGVLFAPDRGRETRRKIINNASDIKDAACNVYNSIAEIAEEQYNRIKTKTQALMQKADFKFDGVEDDTAAMFD